MICLMMGKHYIQVERVCQNTNQFVSIPFLAKTGTGQRAKFCIAGFNPNTEDVVIILGAADDNFRYQKVESLLN